jgi:hypothetical protein
VPEAASSPDSAAQSQQFVCGDFHLQTQLLVLAHLVVQPIHELLEGRVVHSVVPPFTKQSGFQEEAHGFATPIGI